jgi:hypothetical protein
MISNKSRTPWHTEVCSSLRPLYDQQVIDVRHSSVVRNTYVSRESTRVTPSPSIPLTRCSRRTMPRFPYVVLSKLSFDLSTDQGETASVECPFPAGHLQNTIGLGNEREREKQQTFHLVHFVWCLVKSDNALKSVRVILVLRETHTRMDGTQGLCNGRQSFILR